MDAGAKVGIGTLEEEIAAAKGAVRGEPSRADLRAVLFQLYCVQGNWEAAGTQLEVAEGLDPTQALYANLYRKALACEAVRLQVFSGKQAPAIFGEPPPWAGLAVKACAYSSEGRWEEARDCQRQAFEQAPDFAARIDGQPVEWVADGDSRLGPMVEACIEGRYFWIPFSNIQSIRVGRPECSIDAVWVSARFAWTDGSEAGGLIPVRYPGSERSGSDSIRMARETEWVEHGEGFYSGLGHRIYMSDKGDHPLLNISEMEFQHG